MQRLYTKNIFNGSKMPVIPPLLTNDTLASDFQEKANRFNKFFSRHCLPLIKGSECLSQTIFVTN